MDDDRINNKPMSEGRSRFLIGSAHTGAAALLLGGRGVATAKAGAVASSSEQVQRRYTRNDAYRIKRQRHESPSGAR
jgi:hypothetical protein